MLAVLAAPVAGAEGGRPVGQPLDVWGEWERLRAAIGVRDAIDGGGVPWAVARLTPPTPMALDDTLAAAGAGFQAVHFGCHGGPHGLHLEDNLGRECELPTERLVTALRGRGVQLVVLNACATAEVARELVERAGVTAVIATRELLLDREARVLAERLYRGLAIGRPVGEALHAARQTIAARHRAGELGVPGASGDFADRRADNVFLAGDPQLTLTADEPAASGPLFVLDPTPRNDPLPLDLVADFVGRHAELLKLATWLAETGHLAFAISGVGGVGKTALALNAALRSAHHFDALAFASARDTPHLSPARILEAIAAAQNVATSAEEANDPAGAVVRRMNASPILLLLDNLESLDPAQTAELARTLRGVRPQSGSRVILTLRPREKDALTRRIGRGDRIELITLDRPNALRMTWNQADRHDLFAGTPPAPTDAPPEGGAGALARTAREAWLEGCDTVWLHAADELAAKAFRHPKMIELAVSLVADRGWSAAHTRLTQLAGREITEAFEELIGTLVDDVAERSPEALDVLHAALVFRGGAATPLLRYVVLGREVADDSAEALEFEDGPLEVAHRSSLLSRRDELASGGGTRFDLDPSIRAYLERFRPPESENFETLGLRHAEALIASLEAADHATRRGEMSLAAIPEWSNLTTAWQWLAEQPTGARGERLVAHSRLWLNLLIPTKEPRAKEWLEAALVAARDADDRLAEANVLLGLGQVAAFQREFETCSSHSQAALAIYRDLGHGLGTANTLFQLAELGVVSELYREGAVAHCNEALELYRSVGAKLGEANTLRSLGTLFFLQDNLDASLRDHQAALDLYRDINNPMGEANALTGMAWIALKREDHQESQRLLEEFSAIYRRIGDFYSEAAQIGNYGWALLELERPAQARRYLAMAADLFERMGPGMEPYRVRHREAVKTIDEAPSP